LDSLKSFWAHTGPAIAGRIDEFVEAIDQLLLADVEIPVEKAQKLTLHLLDVLLVEHTASPDSPVVILGSAIIKVLGRNHNGSKKDPMLAAGHG
jgi:hypothetical protein